MTRRANELISRVPWARGPVTVAVSAFVVLTSVLFGMGLRVGVGFAELVPTAVIEALVIGGLLFVACLPPEDVPDHGGLPPQGPDPAAAPPPFDPAAWLPLWDVARELPAEPPVHAEPAAAH